MKEQTKGANQTDNGMEGVISPNIRYTMLQTGIYKTNYFIRVIDDYNMACKPFSGNYVRDRRAHFKIKSIYYGLAA